MNAGCVGDLSIGASSAKVTDCPFVHSHASPRRIGFLSFSLVLKVGNGIFLCGLPVNGDVARARSGTWSFGVCSCGTRASVASCATHCRRRVSESSGRSWQLRCVVCGVCLYPIVAGALVPLRTNAAPTARRDRTGTRQPSARARNARAPRTPGVSIRRPDRQRSGSARLRSLFNST